MDFMDLDVDLEADPVDDFLKNKLEEIKHDNIKLSEVLQELEEETEKAIGQIVDISNEVIIEKSWIKLINDKYTIWFTIKNKTHENLKNCRLILSWNSRSPLLYECRMYRIPRTDEFNKNFAQIDAIDKLGNIIAVLDNPDFLQQLEFEITGLFSFTLNGEEYNVELPEIFLAAHDATDRQKIIPIYKLIELHIPDFVSCLASSNITNLVMKIPGIEREINSILEIDVALYKVNFKERDGRFFLAHKISPSFDGSILEITKNSEILRVKIYHRDNDSLRSFVHHLHKSIKSLILLPEEFEIRLHSKSLQECESQIEQSMLNEIKFSKDFLKYMQTSGSTSERIRRFQLELCDLEHTTDKAYIQLRVAQNREGVDA